MIKGQAQGLLYNLIASLFFTTMVASVYLASKNEAHVDALTTSFIRIFVNLIVIVILTLAKKEYDSIKLHLQGTLWLRGLFGSLSLMLYFAAIQRVGPAHSSLYQGTSGIWLAALTPIVMNTRTSWVEWVAILGSFLGIVLLYGGGGGMEDSLGKFFALGSGLLSALAYLMIARAGKKVSPEKVVFSFCLTGVFLHSVIFAVYPPHWPELFSTYLFCVAAGVCASFGQIFMTRAYQRAEAPLVAAVGYSAPFLSVCVGVVFFRDPLTSGLVAGGGLIILCGMLLPFLALKHHA